MTQSLFWFRQDLRLDDNPALLRAIEADHAIFVYIKDDTLSTDHQMGGAQKWWLHHSLSALSDSLRNKNTRLLLKSGSPKEILLNIAKEFNIDNVYWNRCYEPHSIARDKEIKASLKEAGVQVESYNASLLHEPWTVENKSGGNFKVFTPFWKHCVNELTVDDPQDLPSGNFPPEPDGLESDNLEEWSLLPKNPDWSTGFAPHWQPGEAGARKRWDAYRDEHIGDYKDLRNHPAENLNGPKGTSLLSPHLHFGEISPRRMFHETRFKMGQGGNVKGMETYLSEMGWREFGYNLLYHNPHIQFENYNKKFDAMPWRDDKDHYAAWTKGMTGYPIVDAGMRELYETGYLHNRVRMIVASFLTKHLLLPWQWGERWFWDCLLDADVASNGASWQWTAGSGADAAPYFRIFNPITQGERFDANGDYTRHWVPELKNMPRKFLFEPWEAPALVQKEAGCIIGEDYPAPIVNHPEARDRALQAYESVKNAGAEAA